MMSKYGKNEKVSLEPLGECVHTGASDSSLDTLRKGAKCMILIQIVYLQYANIHFCFQKKNSQLERALAYSYVLSKTSRISDSNTLKGLEVITSVRTQAHVDFHIQSRQAYFYFRVSSCKLLACFTAKTLPGVVVAVVVLVYENTWRLSWGMEIWVQKSATFTNVN